MPDIVNLLKSPVLFDHKTHPAFQREVIENTINEIVALRAKLAKAEAELADSEARVDRYIQCLTVVPTEGGQDE